MTERERQSAIEATIRRLDDEEAASPAGVSAGEFAAALGSGSAASVAEAYNLLASLKAEEAEGLTRRAEFFLRLESLVPAGRTPSEYFSTLKRLQVGRSIRMAVDDVRHGLARSSYRSSASGALLARADALSTAQTFTRLARVSSALGVGLEVVDGWQQLRNAKTPDDIAAALGETSGNIGGGAAGAEVGAAGASVACAVVSGGTCIVVVVVFVGGGATAGSYVGGEFGRELSLHALETVRSSRDLIESASHHGWERTLECAFKAHC